MPEELIELKIGGKVKASTLLCLNDMLDEIWGESLEEINTFNRIEGGLFFDAGEGQGVDASPVLDYLRQCNIPFDLRTKRSGDNYTIEHYRPSQSVHIDLDILERKVGFKKPKPLSEIKIIDDMGLDDEESHSPRMS